MRRPHIQNLKELELFLFLITYTLEFDPGDPEVNKSSFQFCSQGVHHRCLALDRRVVVVVVMVVYQMVRQIRNSWFPFSTERGQERFMQSEGALRLHFGVIDLDLG